MKKLMMMAMVATTMVGAAQADEPDYLTFTAEEEGSTVTFGWKNGSDVMINTNGTWVAYTEGTTIPLAKIGDKVMFKGNGVTTGDEDGETIGFSMTGKIAASGDVGTLTDGKGGADVTLSKECYTYMFGSCTSLTSAPKLPAANLTENCYGDMFAACISLTAAPELPATNLAPGCYGEMFGGCTSLTTAPTLPATTLANECYNKMFTDCTSLTSAPKLPATNLTKLCYSCMFYRCTSLTDVPELPATNLAMMCYGGMFNGCTALVANTNAPGKAWSISAEAAASAETAENWNAGMFKGTPGDITNTTVTCGVKYYVASAPVEFRVTQPEHATFQAYTNGAPVSVPFTGDYLTDFTVTYTATDNYMFPGGYKTLTTNLTASAAKMTVTLTDEQQPIAAKANPNCITFSAADDFGIRMWKKGIPTVDPSLEYSTDQIYWETFKKDDGAAAGADHKLYLRGAGNTAFASSTSKYYVFTNTSDSAATAIACSGNIETLMDHKQVAAGNHPEMGDCAFSYLFNGFAALTAAPELPATNLARSCYSMMFSGCKSLTEVPDLPATNLQSVCYNTMFRGCTSLVVNTNAPGKVWSIPAEAATSEASASNWNKDMFKRTPGNITNEAVTCGVTYYVASALVPVTVEVPEVAGATAQLLAFNVNGGWASVATNEVPSNATVRVVYTAADGKAWENGVYVWSRELVATESVQTAPAPAEPTAWSGSESSVTLNIDTRTVKKYFEKDDILPIWAAQGAEVEVKKVGGEKTSLVKNMSSTNTFAWLPDSIGVYDFSHTALGSAQIIYTTPVEVTTNGLEVSGTTVAVTADGSPIEPQTEGTYAGKLMVASNSTVTATWTIAPGSGVYFMDGTTTYTQTFEASQSVNPVNEAVTKPETPNAPKLKLGVVAQRYPWDGKIDVQYWAQNTPNEGYQITVTVTLPDGTTASETKPCLNGKNVTDFDARAKFGEVQFPKGVKVKATLEKK